MNMRPRFLIPAVLRAAAFVLFTAIPVTAQQSQLRGTVLDETGAALPGVRVELRTNAAAVRQTQTDERGRYRIDGIAPGQFEVSFTLINFATVRRPVMVGMDELTVDAVMHLVLSADVTVTGKATFTNLADAPTPAQDLVGIAQSASQGAITARQLDTRPIMRPGEVLETVPGVVSSQHSGEGKANQVLPARLQSRSRHGLRHDGRRHAGQHADAWPRPRLLRPQLPDPRARERRAVLEGPVLRRARRLRNCGHGQHQLHEYARPSDRARRRRRRRVRPCPAGGRAGRGRRHAARRARARAQRRTMGASRRPAQVQRRRSLQPRRRAERGVRDIDGLSRHVELDRSNPRARNRRRAARTIRPRGRLRRR